MPLKDFTKEEIEQIVKDSTSLSEVACRLNYHSRGVILYTIKNYMIKNNIDFSHFTGRAKNTVKRTFDNVFMKNSTVSQRILRKWYLKGEYTPYICSICGREPIWEEKSLTLRLDHINGYNKDNRLENLRWVCPNCDSQLDTYNGRNKNHKQRVEKKKAICVDCGCEIYATSTRCKKCSNKRNIASLLSKQKAEGKCLKIPINRDELKGLIRQLPMVEVGKYYGITSNSIKKWCKKYNLPSKVSEIKRISDEDWEKL